MKTFFSFKDVFSPKLFSAIRSYNKEKLLQDSIAGMIVGIVAIPLAIAFGISSGVGPTEGLITAIIAGFIISAFGGSKVQIGGPTGAFIVIIYGIIQQHGLAGLLIATIMAGIILIVMGICRFGSLLKYIPDPITTGFTAGIAVTLFIGQIKDFLGLQYADGVKPIEAIEKIIAIARRTEMTFFICSFLLNKNS